MADANQQLTWTRRSGWGGCWSRIELTWFEEPLPAYDLAGVARVAAALDTPIASGETEYTRYGFRRMLELKAADVLMPDLQRVGGVTEFLRVGHMADAFDVAGIVAFVPGDVDPGAGGARQCDVARAHAVVLAAVCGGAGAG